MIPEEPNFFLNKYANHITDDNIIDRRKMEKELLEMKLSIILDTFSSNKFQAAMLRLS